jgi:hypothetical protein
VTSQVGSKLGDLHAWKSLPYFMEVGWTGREGVWCPVGGLTVLLLLPHGSLK